MNRASAWVVGVIGFLGVMAIVSRLLTTKESAPTIDNAVKAVQNLFNGAFFS